MHRCTSRVCVQIWHTDHFIKSISYMHRYLFPTTMLSETSNLRLLMDHRSLKQFIFTQKCSLNGTAVKNGKSLVPFLALNNRRLKCSCVYSALSGFLLVCLREIDISAAGKNAPATVHDHREPGQRAGSLDSGRTPSGKEDAAGPDSARLRAPFACRGLHCRYSVPGRDVGRP